MSSSVYNPRCAVNGRFITWNDFATYFRNYFKKVNDDFMVEQVWLFSKEGSKTPEIIYSKKNNYPSDENLNYENIIVKPNLDKEYVTFTDLLHIVKVVLNYHEKDEQGNYIKDAEGKLKDNIEKPSDAPNLNIVVDPNHRNENDYVRMCDISLVGEKIEKTTAFNEDIKVLLTSEKILTERDSYIFTAKLDKISAYPIMLTISYKNIVNYYSFHNSKYYVPEITDSTVNITIPAEQDTGSVTVSRVKSFQGVQVTLLQKDLNRYTIEIDVDILFVQLKYFQGKYKIYFDLNIDSTSEDYRNSSVFYDSENGSEYPILLEMTYSPVYCTYDTSIDNPAAKHFTVIMPADTSSKILETSTEKGFYNEFNTHGMFKYNHLHGNVVTSDENDSESNYLIMYNESCVLHKSDLLDKTLVYLTEEQYKNTGEYRVYATVDSSLEYDLKTVISLYTTTVPITINKGYRQGYRRINSPIGAKITDPYPYVIKDKEDLNDYYAINNIPYIDDSMSTKLLSDDIVLTFYNELDDEEKYIHISASKLLSYAINVKIVTSSDTIPYTLPANRSLWPGDDIIDVNDITDVIIEKTQDNDDNTYSYIIDKSTLVEEDKTGEDILVTISEEKKDNKYVLKASVDKLLEYTIKVMLTDNDDNQYMLKILSGSSSATYTSLSVMTNNIKNVLIEKVSEKDYNNYQYKIITYTAAIVDTSIYVYLNANYMVDPSTDIPLTFAFDLIYTSKEFSTQEIQNTYTVNFNLLWNATNHSLYNPLNFILLSDLDQDKNEIANINDTSLTYSLDGQSGDLYSTKYVSPYTANNTPYTRKINISAIPTVKLTNFEGKTFTCSYLKPLKYLVKVLYMSEFSKMNYQEPLLKLSADTRSSLLFDSSMCDLSEFRVNTGDYPEINDFVLEGYREYVLNRNGDAVAKTKGGPLANIYITLESGSDDLTLGLTNIGSVLLGIYREKSNGTAFNSTEIYGTHWDNNPICLMIANNGMTSSEPNILYSRLIPPIVEGVNTYDSIDNDPDDPNQTDDTVDVVGDGVNGHGASDYNQPTGSNDNSRGSTGSSGTTSTGSKPNVLDPKPATVIELPVASETILYDYDKYTTVMWGNETTIYFTWKYTFYGKLKTSSTKKFHVTIGGIGYDMYTNFRLQVDIYKDTTYSQSSLLCTLQAGITLGQWYLSCVYDPEEMKDDTPVYIKCTLYNNLNGGTDVRTKYSKFGYTEITIQTTIVNYNNYSFFILASD